VGTVLIASAKETLEEIREQKETAGFKERRETREARGRQEKVRILPVPGFPTGRGEAGRKGVKKGKKRKYRWKREEIERSRKKGGDRDEISYDG